MEHKPMDLDRRRFLRMALTSMIAAPLTGGCRREAAPAPFVPLGDPRATLKVRGYRGLAELPYFAVDANGDLRLTVDDLPAGLDFHTHLAFNMLLSPSVDLLRRTPDTHYLIDCDGSQPPCVLDLDVYMNRIATPDMLDHMEAEIRGMLLFGSRAAETHTIPNLLAEMDRMRVERAVVLAVSPGFPFGDNLTQQWRDAIAQSGAAERLILFGSVRPTARGAVERLRELKTLGIRGVKLHPTMQRFYPDDPQAMPFYAACAELQLPVFFHAGRAGIEPEFTREHAAMKHYVAPVAEFPQVRFIFGHAGARDYADAIPIAKAHPNVLMEIAGQGVAALRELLRELGPERLVFGSDWPFYPLAPTVAKLLIVTDGDKAARDMIFSGNARRFLALSAP
jgi:predicted TIM-barrel fold metal-dependent hydrolase